MQINPADFYRMSMFVFDQLESIGITTVERLAVMTPKEIESLPVTGIGNALSKRWSQTAKDLLLTVWLH